MSRENVEVLSSGYEWFTEKRTFPAHLATPDFVWDMSHFQGWPEQQVYEGAQGADEFFAEWGTAWDDWEVVVETMYDVGDKVVAIVHQRGRSKISGMTVEMSMGHVWTFRDGKEARMEMYSNPSEALKAVGLEKQTMSQGNVEIAEAFYSALIREDDQRLLGLLDPAIEYVNPDGAIEPGVRRGAEDYFAILEEMREAWAYWRMYPERYVPVADRVAVVYRYEAQARSSGVRLAGRESARLTLRHGKIVRYEWFHAPEDAVADLGLEE